jgi:YfiH family protein
MIASPQLGAIGHVRHGFFTRQGGRSAGIYASLNCGYGSNDEADKVAANRAIVAGRLGVEAQRLLTVWQWHSADVAVARAPWDALHPPKADAMVTDVAGMALGVLTADCTPVLFADRQKRVVGAAHAGWKGALGGVIEATVAAMEGLGAARGRIAAVIGPTISQASYEVGPEFHARFVAADESHGRFFAPSARAGHFRFDLPGLVRMQLEQAELAAIEDMGLCTYGDEQSFFSYRRTTHRGEPDYGRQIAAIAIAD